MGKMATYTKTCKWSTLDEFNYRTVCTTVIFCMIFAVGLNIIDNSSNIRRILEQKNLFVIYDLFRMGSECEWGDFNRAIHYPLQLYGTCSMVNDVTLAWLSQTVWCADLTQCCDVEANPGPPPNNQTSTGTPIK